jgi:hypothetical protein
VSSARPAWTFALDYPAVVDVALDRAGVRLAGQHRRRAAVSATTTRPPARSFPVEQRNFRLRNHADNETFCRVRPKLANLVPLDLGFAK